MVGRNDIVKSPIVKIPNKMVPMGNYFYEITLENFEFVNLITGYKCGEALLPNDLAKFSSLFPFGYSENCSFFLPHGE